MSSLRLTSPRYPPTEPHMYIPLTFRFTAVSPPNTYGPGHSPVASSCRCHNVTPLTPHTHSFHQGRPGGLVPPECVQQFLQSHHHPSLVGVIAEDARGHKLVILNKQLSLGLGGAPAATFKWRYHTLVNSPCAPGSPGRQQGTSGGERTWHTHTSHTAGLTRTKAVV